MGATLPPFLTLPPAPVLGTANRMLSSHYWLQGIVKWCGWISISSAHATVVACSQHSDDRVFAIAQEPAMQGRAWLLMLGTVSRPREIEARISARRHRKALALVAAVGC